MAPEPSSPRLDIYRKVTDSIVAQIEAGAGTYRMPWHHSGAPTMRPRNPVTQSFYRGVNVLTLWAAAQATGYPNGLWATYRQWQQLKAQVRSGERGQLIVFWKSPERPEEPDSDEGGEAEVPRSKKIVARGFWVFNIAQVDGYTAPLTPSLPTSERIARAEQFWTALGIQLRIGGDEAFYNRKWDYVQLPPFEQFRDVEGYYATLLHEAAHATGAKPRLNRDLSGRFGSEAYAAEELIAELASAFACLTLDLAPEPRPDHAGYIASWLSVLKSDSRAVFAAASQAQKIVDWMCERQQATTE